MALPSLADTSALIRLRRSIKPVDMEATRPLERELIEHLLEDATWAPTHGLTEPWRFRVFTGASARKELAGTLQRIYREVTPPAQFQEDKLKKLGENPLLAPAVVACWMERSSGDKIPEIEEIEAVACALQNLMLAATAAGLGSFWSSPPLLESEPFQQWLGIRKEDRCVGLIYLGWPRDGRTPPKSARRPLSEVVTWRSDA